MTRLQDTIKAGFTCKAKLYPIKPKINHRFCIQVRALVTQWPVTLVSSTVISIPKTLHEGGLCSGTVNFRARRKRLESLFKLSRTIIHLF